MTPIRTRTVAALPLLVLALICLAPLAGCEGDKPSATPTFTGAEDEFGPVTVTDFGITIDLTPTKTNMLEIELYDLSGTRLASATSRSDSHLKMTALAGAVDPTDLANYYVRYRFDPEGEFRQRSLLFLNQIVETTVLGQRDLLAGTTAPIRIFVSDRTIAQPIAGAAVTVTLTDDGGEVAGTTGTTNEKGELVAQLTVPDREIESAVLTVTVDAETASNTVSETVSIGNPTKTLLVTDKPLYQPGQTIHIRALSLKRPGMTPLAGADVVFEIEDAKGNKVFKQVATTDNFGVSHADFVLATELNKGPYRIRTVIDGAKEEKTVTVDRYVLPKFKIDFKTDRRFYQPGDMVEVDLQADYFFGKPVAGAAVKVTCSKFDVGYQDFQVVEGVTDADGHYHFKVPLPEHFVGQPLEAGKASAKFTVQLIDTADHKEVLTRNVAVTASPIIVAAVPESGQLIDGLENRVYVVTTYADSTPTSCTVKCVLVPNGKAMTIQTDEAGFGQFTFTPQPGQPVSLQLSATDAQGHAGKTTANLDVKTASGDDRVLVRTDKALYAVGDELALSIVSSRRTGSVYVDVIKDRQTYLTQTLDLVDGKAASTITLDANMAGTLQVNAYLIGANGVIVRDRRLIIADPANDLRIQIDGDADTYLPGADATITFRVSGADGSGTAAALGVMVVDEAVFALQEMQPGLEKVYFYLEKEIATPRYEVHGYDLGGCLPPTPFPASGPELLRRDAAARVLLASAEGVGDYSIHVNRRVENDQTPAFQAKMQALFTDRVLKIAQALAKYSQEHRDDADKRTEGISLTDLVDADFLDAELAADPWDNPLTITGEWHVGQQIYHEFTLVSAGIDGAEGTADDVLADGRQILRRLERRRWRNAPMDMEMADGAVPMPMAAAGEGVPDVFATAVEEREGLGAGGPQSGESAAPRIRKYFPETLYFNPALITDATGKAVLTIPLADSITTWRMTCMASSSAGALGSTTAGIRVFQDFFVDVDFPVALTQNDQVSVPVVVYNYLKTDQQVRLVVTEEDWFELKGPAEQTVTLGPSEVKAVYFPVTVKRIGFHRFTITGFGQSKSDAVARSVEIVPDGTEHLLTHSGRLEGNVSHTISIPTDAIDEASKIFVKVYPGMLSQVVEGLDSMLRMPSGCFEQTSSTTYPNILVLDYMKTTGKITPELQMKAEGFINAGYQRLLSFEVDGGGFEWFGNPPAHRILTAYGLMEFHDMSKVFEVDPAVITRTQAWLASCQEADGSYKPSQGGIAEGAINKFTDDVFRNTAYITWALASTGHQEPEIAKGISYLRQHLDEMADTYTIALTANTFATVEPKSDTTAAIVATLMSKAIEEDDAVHWAAGSETPTHGTGVSADLEVTALVVQAFVRSGLEFSTVSKAVTYLARNKDAYGTWQSTQATIQSLRAMLMAERDATAQTTAKIVLSVNGNSVKTLTVDETNSDVLQLVDLKDVTAEGDTEVSMKFSGEGSLLYQIVGRYFLPHAERPAMDLPEPMTITLDYDRDKLVVNDRITATATIKNNRPAAAQMVIVDLGLPPGFTLVPDKLNALVADKTIEKYSVTGRQIIVYLREVAAEPITIQYELQAKYPLRAKTTESVVYEYYNPEIRTAVAPVQLTVTGEE